MNAPGKTTSWTTIDESDAPMRVYSSFTDRNPIGSAIYTKRNAHLQEHAVKYAR